MCIRCGHFYDAHNFFVVYCLPKASLHHQHRCLHYIVINFYDGLSNLLTSSSRPGHFSDGGGGGGGCGGYQGNAVRGA